ncbi:MAG TPA: serine/threonine-protein kinase, partial [Aggregatilineales bacterium]|nr:serine/threonine-protein kinase [Aggregatilineales bacterium]
MANLVGKQLGQYVITVQIGKGGMATVYRAHHAAMDRDVAIKVMDDEIARQPEFIARFEREAKLIARLQHPHILPVYDYARTDEVTYLVMRLVEGESLDKRLRTGKLPLELIVRLFDQIADALAYAHTQGVVHRDLKPNNILLDSTSNAYLTDFGIAKMVQSHTQLTAAGLVMGTPSYMAPELWRGEQIDTRVDIYALGIMLYEMLTGELPFTADTPFALMSKHIDTPLPSPVLKRPEIPPAMDEAIRTATAKTAANRYTSALDFAAAVDDGYASTQSRRRPTAHSAPP